MLRPTFIDSARFLGQIVSSSALVHRLFQSNHSQTSLKVTCGHVIVALTAKGAIINYQGFFQLPQYILFRRQPHHYHLYTFHLHQILGEN